MRSQYLIYSGKKTKSHLYIWILKKKNNTEKTKTLTFPKIGIVVISLGKLSVWLQLPLPQNADVPLGKTVNLVTFASVTGWMCFSEWWKKHFLNVSNIIAILLQSFISASLVSITLQASQIIPRHCCDHNPIVARKWKCFANEIIIINLCCC